MVDYLKATAIAVVTFGGFLIFLEVLKGLVST